MSNEKEIVLEFDTAHYLHEKDDDDWDILDTRIELHKNNRPVDLDKE